MIVDAKHQAGSIKEKAVHQSSICFITSRFRGKMKYGSGIVSAPHR